jgi:putative redox protein
MNCWATSSTCAGCGSPTPRRRLRGRHRRTRHHASTGPQCRSITIRDHQVTIDQPVELGGADTGPTPTELFVASLASCVGFYARRHLARHNLDSKGLSVEASYKVGVKPARVTAVHITIHAPAGLPQMRREALVAVAGRCTVHNSITTAPTITLDLAHDQADDQADRQVARLAEPTLHGATVSDLPEAPMDSAAAIQPSIP